MNWTNFDKLNGYAKLMGLKNQVCLKEVMIGDNVAKRVA